MSVRSKLQRWRENRRLTRAINGSTNWRLVGIVCASITAGVYTAEHMERDFWHFVLIGSVMWWGIYGAYMAITELLARCREYDRVLRERGVHPDQELIRRARGQAEAASRE